VQVSLVYSLGSSSTDYDAHRLDVLSGPLYDRRLMGMHSINLQNQFIDDFGVDSYHFPLSGSSRMPHWIASYDIHRRAGPNWSFSRFSVFPPPLASVVSVEHIDQCNDR
jgi:hypothetical protein